ncbi:MULTISPECIES: glycosyltransferase family 4 protein [unclassified Leeuwenhoekiella]|uniref:glycosyltransferase family 4 protein n=1 Tax=unclassified Leeuwenhoekiella TaxID=2615029 RepID=UPI000C3F739A|nr:MULTISPECIES: glycosyltransferase family 4 protein [unclassified Leeuwenhoekiella]MAW93914.1 glycosyltransferase [Leeuwenhoekiella sp.]MBA81672.1 glycosyltransferase [Leeuwenhoekiella sp.]|tara:strand:- start:25927 stop:27153 length:1227 start_codon:yes stop_codon:yes gene_type:complete
MKALIIGNVWPEPVSSAAGTRIMQLLDALQQVGCKVHFACAAGKTPYAENLEALEVCSQEIKLNDASFDAYIKNLQPDLVLFDKFVIEEQFGWRVKEHCPDALRVLETIDLHGLRKGREAALKEGADFSKKYLHNDFAKREIASIYRCDLTLVISEFEMALLQDFFKVPASQLLYLPFMVEAITKDEVKRWKSLKDRKHFVTIGNFRHEPNWLSVRYLKTEIWPHIRKQLPDAEMHVYGSYPAEKHSQLHNPREKFQVLGRAESAHEVIEDSRVLLAPLLTGAGLKGKLLDAMQCGTPAVTTSVGAEGMHGKLPFNGSIADTPEAFAQAAIDLYSNSESWQEAQNNGVEIINTRFQADFWQPVFAERLNHLKENLADYRLHNFTGAMLWHQSLQASKFMSKWIELKNK